MNITLTLMVAALLAAATTDGTAQVAVNNADTNAPVQAKLPRLVDLGADKCIPCKKMAPILKELKKDYAGRFDVDFIDVWKKPEAAKPYKIRLEGFFSKEDILVKWKDLGVNLKRAK
jgi:thioredoxin 1